MEDQIKVERVSADADLQQVFAIRRKQRIHHMPAVQRSCFREIKRGILIGPYFEPLQQYR